MSRSKPKITLLGAGSGFTLPLFTDILSIEGLPAGTIGLVDLDRKRLDINIRLMKRVLEIMDRKRWKIEASANRRRILPGTDYLISTIEVSGVPCVRHDNDIPLKYGIDQCIGDTIGPGGVMKALRTVPSWLKILEDAKRDCPNAMIMNYTNPMSIMSLAAVRTTDQPFVGLCHSVQGGWRFMADVAGVPQDELEWQCGGINHMAWFTELRWRGKDLYPRLLAAIENPEIYEKEPVRFEMMKEFGYFVTESSGHFSEYVPYFRKRKDVLKKYCRDKYRGGSGFYASVWPAWRAHTDKIRRHMVEGKRDIPIKRGHEFASYIVEAHHLNRAKTVHASVANTGLITNLPQTGVVEVPVLIDGQGYTPTYFGDLPEQCAALCRSNMAVFELCVQGILNRDRESVIHAMMLDPLSAAVCSPAEIRSMAEELFRAEKKYVPSWCQRKKGAKRVKAPRRRGRVGDAAAQVSSMAARGAGK
ncbi:alpha-glucosidase/alpha-galactosidase [Planctomycetota bacterium]